MIVDLTDSEHEHWWVIDSPAGPNSWGECRSCGERREFRNAFVWTGLKVGKARQEVARRP